MKFTADVAYIARRPLTEAAIEAIAEIGGAASGKVGGKRITTFITVDAPDMPAATAAAIETIAERVPGKAESVEVMTTKEHDRRLAQKPRQLGGLGEVAQLLGVSRTRVSQLRDRKDFPRPLAEISSGPVWDLGDLSRFADGWQRKPGRRSKPNGAESHARL